MSRPELVPGYLVVDRRTGLVLAWRSAAVHAFTVADQHGGHCVVRLVRIPRAQIILYATAELVRRDSTVPPPAPPDEETRFLDVERVTAVEMMIRRSRKPPSGEGQS